MKSDVKSLLSLSLPAKKQPSSLIDIPSALTFEIRDNTTTSTTFDVLDDSIPIVEGVPIDSFRWPEELS
jgi:hypothetical protein